ncbi:DUF2283 domain-containing protein [[Limnothrix rosea] IAM M-220]|uniref:DUF2283 domain-containing protein n=1 Tax=[Limnothrix rosea] IAM M-220 TaxID=454133 RepID=UPI000966A103|nr:DUF2283 domain-containing protein [[Limnothrix rosea] IAM M-220]OKH15246.1 hypothetical protein NIES208_12855 [[Limnothrix rosea] IAM M-220]
MAVVEESLDYLKFVPLLQDLPKRPFLLLYDAEADVLYIDFHNPPISSDDTELTDDDVVIRYGENDEVVGLTVLHAGDRPLPKLA